MENLERILRRIGALVYDIKVASNFSEARMGLYAFNEIVGIASELGFISGFRIIPNEEAKTVARDMLPLMAISSQDEIQERVFAVLREHGMPDEIIEGCKPFIAKREEAVSTDAIRAEIARLNPVIGMRLSQAESEINLLRASFADLLLTQRQVVANSLELIDGVLGKLGISEEPEDLIEIRQYCGYDPQVLLYPLEQMGFDTRLLNHFRRNYTYVYEVIGLNEHELLQLPGVGKGSVQSLVTVLDQLGLQLGTTLDPRVKKWVQLTALKESRGRTAHALVG